MVSVNDGKFEHSFIELDDARFLGNKFKRNRKRWLRETLRVKFWTNVQISSGKIAVY